MPYHSGLGFPWLIIAVIAVVPFWQLCKRTGYSPWLSLLLVNIVFIYYLAFSDWPAHKSGGGGTPAAPG